MADLAKIAVKLGLVAIFTVAIIALFVGIQFPTVELTVDMLAGIGKAKAFVIYWVPNYGALLTFALAVIGFELGVLLFKFSVQAAKWLQKVNE